MRLYEIISTNTVNILENGLYDLQVYLNDHPHLITESDNEHTHYADLIKDESKYTVPITTPTVNQLYSPLSIFAIPVGRIMTIYCSKADTIKFVSSSARELVFCDKHGSNVIFPGNLKLLGDACVDVLIFADATECKQFISLIKLKFSNWTITVKYQ